VKFENDSVSNIRNYRSKCIEFPDGFAEMRLLIVISNPLSVVVFGENLRIFFAFVLSAHTHFSSGILVLNSTYRIRQAHNNNNTIRPWFCSKILY